jgi:hypothetical protein
MRSAYILSFSVALVALFACGSGANKENKAAVTSDTTAAATSENIDLSNTDSVELLHFNDPANQRIYSRSLIKDTHFIQLISRNVQNQPVQHAACGNDFKLFFFRNGEVYKTIYASTADTCRYFAYIINGQTFFADMNDSALALLNAQVKP